jgi:hypothetical protein
MNEMKEINHQREVPWRGPGAAAVGGKEEREDGREGVKGQVEAQAVARNDPRIKERLPQARHLGVRVRTRQERHPALIVRRQFFFSGARQYLMLLVHVVPTTTANKYQNK